MSNQVSASTAFVLNTTNHNDDTTGSSSPEGNVYTTATTTEGVASDTTTTTSNSTPPTTTGTTLLPFHLPDGRLIDGKNTLQSFDTVAAAAAAMQQQQQPKPYLTPSTMKPSATILPVENNNNNNINTNVPSSNTNIDTNNTNSNNNINNSNNNNEDTNPPNGNENENVIRAQAVPVQSMVVAEGEIFHPPPTSSMLLARKSTAFWVAIILAILLVIVITGVAVGVGVYSALNDNNTPASPPIMINSNSPVTIITPIPNTSSPASLVSPPTNPSSDVTTELPTISPIIVDTETPMTPNPTLRPIDVTNVPILSPILITTPTNPTTTTRPINEQLTVACNFLTLTNLTECQTTTEFFGSAGNTIPTEIGLLTQLTYLSLTRNELTGTIPSTLGQLMQLAYLDLSINQLFGTIPSTLGNLVQLTWLSLYDNIQLSGTIPLTLGNLIQLTDLDLGINQLIGTIPSTLGNLIQLNALSLSSNQLIGTIPSTFGQLTQLNYLRFSFNQLNGTIPSTLGNLTQLTYLYFDNNPQLSGTVPSVLCSISSDISIGIDCDNIVCTCCLDGSTYNSDTDVFDGSCPTTRVCQWQATMIGYKDGVETAGIICDDPNSGIPNELLLFSNNLSGTIPTENGLLTSLTRLDFSFNERLTGSIPTELCQLQHLQQFDLSWNTMTGTIPSCIGMNMSNLQYLYLPGNAFYGTIPSHLGLLTQLQRFIVEDNMLTGNPISVWNNMTQLEMLYASQSNFTGVIDNNFFPRGHKTILIIDVSHNQFTFDTTEWNNAFPHHLLNLFNLTHLDLSNNPLQGTFPRNLFPPHAVNSELVYLSMYNTKMNGTFPNLQQLVNIQHLDFAKNHFYGTLPSYLGTNNTHLELLYLSENVHFFPGTIPSTLVHLTKLRDFSLRNTQLQGAIPSFIGSSLTNLVLLDLGLNNLTNTVPSSLGNLKKLEYLLLNGNLNLTGGLHPITATNHPHLKVLLVDGTEIKLISINCEFTVSSTSNVTLPLKVYTDCVQPAISPCECCKCCPVADGFGCSQALLANMDASWLQTFDRTSYTLFENEEHS